MAPRRVKPPRSRTEAFVAKLTLDYWREEKGYGGQLREIPEVISQGKTVASLRNNIRSCLGTWRAYCRDRERSRRAREGQARKSPGRRL